jgi:general secretion pathway protein C
VSRFQLSSRKQDVMEAVEKFPLRPTLIALSSSFALATISSLVISSLLFNQTEQGAASDLKKMAMNAPGTYNPVPLNAKDLEIILKRNLFNSSGELGGIEQTRTNEQPTSGQKMVKTDLPIVVVGLIYGGTPYSGLVAIKNTKKNRTNSFVVGDTILSGKVAEILRDRVVLVREGRREFALLEDFKLERSKRNKGVTSRSAKSSSRIAKGPAPSSFREDGFERKGSEVKMTTEYKNRLIGDDLTKTLQDAKAEPNIDKATGRLRGFRLTRIRENSIYLKTGLQNDDIVEEINGNALTSVAGAMNLLNSLRSENSIEIRVVRNGSPMTFSIGVD